MTCHVPNKFVEEALKRSIKNKEYQEYAPPMGIPLLHELILKDFELEDTDAVVCVTDGSLPAIFQAISQLNTFNTFIDSEPACPWPRLYNNVNLELILGKIKPSDIVENSLVNICNPQNPLGHLYTKEELEAIGEKTNEVGAYILYDCTYKDFIDEYIPLYKLNPERTITTWSMSKSPGLAGMRVGGVICSPDMMDKLYTLRPNQLGSSFPGQKAAISSLYLKDQWRPDLRKIVDLNRDCLYNNLPDCTFPMEDASSSVWVELPKEVDSSDLTAKLRKQEIFVRDGIYYQGFRWRAIYYKEYGYEGNFIKVGTAVPMQWIFDLCKAINTCIT